MQAQAYIRPLACAINLLATKWLTMWIYVDEQGINFGMQKHYGSGSSELAYLQLEDWFANGITALMFREPFKESRMAT